MTKRLNKKDKVARGEKWADWIRNVKLDIINEGLYEYKCMNRAALSIEAVSNPEKFLVMFELIEIFDRARKEVNAKDYNNMYHQKDSFLYDPTIKKVNVDLLPYQELIDICEKYQKYFISYKIPAYIAEFKKLPEVSKPLDNFIEKEPVEKKENKRMTTDERECGYVQLHKLYLTQEPGGLTYLCDRLPIALESCPTCGSVPHFSRGITKIDPYQLWGIHNPCKCESICPLCNPQPVDEGKSFLMWIGEKYYTVDSFLQESDKLGVSKAIPFIPKDFELGKSWVYFARRNYVDKVEGFHPEPKKVKKVDGVFSAFRPTKIEYVITETEAEDEELMKGLQEKGITALIVPDDDENHVPKSAKYKIRKKYQNKNKKKLDTFMELHCPNCDDTYKPTYPSKQEAFETEDNEAREQWITGLCSTVCWNQFLAVDGEEPKNIQRLKDAMKNV